MTNELLANAGKGLPAIRFATDSAPRRADVPDYEEQIEERMELLDALSHITVSEATRALCEQEMRNAERRGWKC